SDARSSSDTCVPCGSGPISTSVPSTSSSSAVELRSSFERIVIPAPCGVRACRRMDKSQDGTLFHKPPNPGRKSARHDLDVTIDTGDDLELALEHLALVAGDR